MIGTLATVATLATAQPLLVHRALQVQINLEDFMALPKVVAARHAPHRAEYDCQPAWQVFLEEASGFLGWGKEATIRTAG
jgi:hypothetical protein